MKNKFFLSVPKKYVQGVLWMIAMCLCSNLNDILVKMLGRNLPSVEIAFFRFVFSGLMLVPLGLSNGISTFRTQCIGLHFIRAILLIIAVSSWCYGISFTSLVTATTISFTTPFFVLFFAKIILREQVEKKNWLATFLGFTAILIIMFPLKGSFNYHAIPLIGSTVLFALLDIINKKALIRKERLFHILFYSSLGCAVLSAMPAIYVWQRPTLQDLFFLFLLGLGANLILYCLLNAYRVSNVSALQHFRYFEFIFSGFFGSFIFNESLLANTIFGLTIIIGTTFLLSLTKKQPSTKKLCFKAQKSD